MEKMLSQRILLAVLLFVCLASQVTTEEEEKMDGVKCSFTLEKKDFVLGEPIYFTFKVENQLQETIRFSIGHTPVDSFKFNMISTKPDDAVVKELDPYCPFGGLSDIDQVKPGKEFSERILLNKYLQFCTAGEFKIECKFNFDIILGEGDRDSILEEIRSGIKPKKIENTNNTQTITLKIKEDKNALLEIIEKLKIGLSDEDWKKQHKAVTALAYIRRVEAIEALSLALKNSNESVVEIALEGLSYLKTEEADKLIADFILEHKDDKDDYLRERAESLLKKREKEKKKATEEKKKKSAQEEKE